MATAAFRREDRVGLIAAMVLHVALVAAFALQFAFAPEPRAVPERMTVSLASNVSMESTAPDPVPESRAAIAPTLTDIPAPATPDAPEAAAPDRAQTPPPPSARRPSRRPAPEEPAPDRARSRPDRDPAPARSRENAGGSRIGDNFLEGRGSSSRTDEAHAPAAAFGASESAALSSAITRQLRPHWNAPTGVDAEKLVSIVSWRLTREGRLSGSPSCRTVPSSITASNRPQAGLHCERAIRAVQLAAPFNLPEQFYSQWDDLEWQFDRRL